MKRAVNTSTQRHCWDCKNWYPATADHFYRDRNRTLGLTNSCKTCIKERSNRWNRENKARHKRNSTQYNKLYYRSTGAQVHARAA